MNSIIDSIFEGIANNTFKVITLSVSIYALFLLTHFAKSARIKAQRPDTEYNKTIQQLKISNPQQYVLDYYHSQGIIIPYDIIEELSFSHLSETEQIYSFIETRRQHIKYECMKKVQKPII